MKTLLTTFAAIAALSTVAQAADRPLVADQDAPYHSKWEPTPTPTATRPAPRPCRFPVRSERTGEILYWNWSDSDCYTVPEDGPRVPDYISDGYPDTVPPIEQDKPKKDKPKKDKPKKDKPKKDKRDNSDANGKGGNKHDRDDHTKGGTETAEDKKAAK